MPWDLAATPQAPRTLRIEQVRVAPGNEVPSDYFDALQAQLEEKLTKIKVFTAVRVELPSDAADVVGTDSYSRKNGALRRGPQPREQKTRPLGRMIVQRVPLAVSSPRRENAPTPPERPFPAPREARNRDAKASLHNTRLRLLDVKARLRGSKERG